MGGRLVDSPVRFGYLMTRGRTNGNKSRSVFHWCPDLSTRYVSSTYSAGLGNSLDRWRGCPVGGFGGWTPPGLKASGGSRLLAVSRLATLRPIATAPFIARSAEHGTEDFGRAS